MLKPAQAQINKTVIMPYLADFIPFILPTQPPPQGIVKDWLNEEIVGFEPDEGLVFYYFAVFVGGTTLFRPVLVVHYPNPIPIL